MDPKLQFFFYLGALVCFALSAFGDALRFGRRPGRAILPAVALVPLGLLLFVFPTVWATGTLAF